AERVLGLQVACPYRPCSAPAGAACRRTDVTGARHETRLLHPVRINTAKREFESATPIRPKARRRALTTRGRPNASWRS
ncbi:zinc finger domain-containing protein, partial [Nocardia farcinica]|uniref:zinc finger domain-containing protein n=1 Tax=Nocardia farcinica TaxID=37329 RepID=UPI003F4D9FE8